MRGGLRAASSYRLVLEVPAGAAAPPHVVSARTASGYQLRIALGGTQPASGLPAATVASAPSSIQAPAGFGREIWEELVEKGFLRRDGIGFYQLVDGK